MPLNPCTGCLLSPVVGMDLTSELCVAGFEKLGTARCTGKGQGKQEGHGRNWTICGQ